ncbi:MAG TPA: rhamnan synthesis F family protein [Ensifer sp.]|nr:rhamnan synthesis F family protein [Ensifer sp.]
MARWQRVEGSFSLPSGSYRLETEGLATEEIDLVDLDDVERGCRLAGGSAYLLQLKRPLTKGLARAAGMSVAKNGVKISRISALNFRLARASALLRRHAQQNFGGGEKLLIKSRDAPALARMAHENVEFRALRIYGLDDNSLEDSGWPWMESSWAIPAPRALGEPLPFPLSPSRVCIYLHMHYWQVWPEIEAVLGELAGQFDLVLTSSSERAAEFERIRATLPGAKIIVTANRGRDVGPFMQLLQDGVFDGYDAVCKIHGKLSLKNGVQSRSGLRIRRYILASLLADGAFHRQVSAFAGDARLGLVGPRNLILPPAGRTGLRYVKSELPKLKGLYERGGLAARPEELRFFAGTMFWFRPAALKGLKDLQIGIGDFDLENGAKRNTLQHALERAFCAFVEHEGYRIAAAHPPAGDGAATGPEYI